MSEIKFDSIVSFSSEDLINKSENLLSGGYWTGLGDNETKQEVTIKLRESSKIRQIDIENKSSAFIEIHGGNENDSEDDYTVILPAMSFMTPSESKNCIHTNRLKIFIDDLNEKTLDRQWQVIKIICTQPFNRSIQFGMKIRAYSEATMDEDKKDAAKINTGIFELKKIFSSTESSSDFKTKANESVLETDNKISSVFQKWKQTEDRKKEAEVEFLDSKEKLEEKKSMETKITENIKAKENVSEATSETSATNSRNTARPTTHRTNTKARPERLKLLNDVVFVLSGFVNPERSEIRDLGNKLGAKYRPDWDNDTCTHLICAFANTPKAVQVRKDGGKVVGKNWLEDCETRATLVECDSYIIKSESSASDSDSDSSDVNGTRKAARKAVHKLSKLKRANDEFNDSLDESAAENSDDRDFIASSSDDSMSMSSSSSSSGSNTSDNNTPKKKSNKKSKKIKKVKREKKAKKVKRTKKRSESSGDSEPDSKKLKKNMDMVEKENKPQIKETNQNVKKGLVYEEEASLPNKASQESWELPEIFERKRFFINGNFDKNVKKSLERTIIGFGGDVDSCMGDEVDFVITDKDWNKEFEMRKKENKNLVIVGEDWISACARRKKLISYKPFEVEEE